MSNPKVFEFAKEVGMTPLALMDKIREWQLPVKSHMAELDTEMLETIKTRLNGPAKTEASAPEKKAPARKKAVASSGGAVKSTAVKATSAKAPTAPSAPAVEKSSAAKTAGAVVRRKVKVEETAAEASAPSTSQDVHDSESVEVAVETAVVAAVKTVEKVEEKVVAAEVQAKVVKSPAPQSAPIGKTAAPMTTPTTSAGIAPSSVKQVQETATPSAVAPTPAVTTAPAARKKEVSIGQSGVASAPPKRNIIGRMDLSRVQSQAPQQRSESGFNRGPRPPGGPGAGAGGMSGGANRFKGNLRTGFVQQQAPIPVFEATNDEFGRKKDEKRRNKGGFGAEAASVKPAEEGENQHFDAAEFRKREMVFQPKKKKGSLARPAMQTQITTPKASKRIVKINNTMKVSDLAMEMGVKAPELIKKLMKEGVMASITTDLDFDTIALVVPDFGFEAQNAYKTAEEIIAAETIVEADSEAVTRPPVVTIMGHVDHGKTSLLDAIRNANVAAGEAGGITQHIGAYQVKTDGGHVITFLDTPGHEAFTAMRARGANVTDIVVIVVAADDGVMPQTAEAISHAKAAGVPMIVAVNKMDKPGANPDRIKQQLTEYEVVPEEWGGTTIFCPVSAIKKTGIKELLEQIHLLAEVGEFKANPNKLGSGSVIEAKLEKGRGNVATILVKDGTVKVGQYIVAGTVSGRVKSLTSDKGEKLQTAGPGTPVEVLGLDGTPLAGDRFDVVKDESVIEDVVRVRKELAEKANAANNKISLEDIFAKVKQGDVKELSVILKTDVSGSLEAVNGMFKKLSTPEVKLKVVHSAVGGITESDVLLAQTAKGIIVGFNVRPDGGATSASKRLGVEIRSYTIVYELIDDIKKAMAGLLAPTIVEKVLGRAEVRNTFVVPKVGTIAGCFVSDGKVTRNSMARLIRDGKIIYEGKVSSLKRFKDDAREVAQGFECGIGIENFNDVKVGDSIESFVKEEVARELTSAPASV